VLTSVLAVTAALSVAELGAHQAGPVKLRFLSSETAAVFRVVDQLSGWSASGPKRFGAIKLTEEDKALLALHGEIRFRVGWQATHAAFAVEASIDEACRTAVALGLLNRADAEIERKVFHAFEQRVREWSAGRAAQLAAAVQRFSGEGSRLAQFAKEAARFSASTLRIVDVYLLPSVEGADGAYTAGRIVLEVPPDATDDPLIHELWHAFAGSHLAQYQRAVQGKPRLDVETLSEGIAYAVQPGLFPAPAVRGALELTIGAALRSGEPSKLMGTTRPLELAVALRPALQRAWSGGSLDAFLPTAAAIFEALTELDKAALATPRGAILYGDTVAHRLPVSVATRRLDPELLKFPDSGMAIGFVLVGRGPEAVPPQFREKYLPRWNEVEAQAPDQAQTLLFLEQEPPVFVVWDRAPDSKDRVTTRVREAVFQLVAAGVERASLRPPEPRDGG
jgi:hypothetical protein